MDEAKITQYITSVFDDVDVVVSSGNSFFFYVPDDGSSPDYRFPFATLVNNDDYEQVSELNRPGVFRLNVGVRMETYRALFGEPPAFPKDGGVIETGHDFAALDRIMPHPIYAAMGWIGVLNPSEVTFETVRTLLAEAYDQAVRRHVRKAPGGERWVPAFGR